MLSHLSLMSAVVYILAFTLTTLLHEVAHALVGLGLGGRPVVYSTFVRHAALSPAAQAMAAAGPVWSLLQGVLCCVLFGVLSDASAIPRLFVLWMGLHGLVNFFGYLMTVPVAPDADLGRVVQYLGWDRRAQYVVCAIGCLAIGLIGYGARGPFLELAPSPAAIATASSRMHYVFEVAVVPWILGAVVGVLTRLPAPHWLSILYPLTSGAFTLITWHAASAVGEGSIHAHAWSVTAFWPWVVALGVVLGLFCVVLAPGIRLGRAERRGARSPSPVSRY